MARNRLVSTVDLGARNARLVADALVAQGATSRATLARVTGLSKPTVSLAIAALVDGGLVHDVGRTTGGPGASAVLYDVDPLAGTALALDVGRRFVRASVSDLAGRMLAERTEPTVGTGRADLARQLVQVSEALLAEAGASSSLVCATVGVPGVVAPEGDRVRLAPTIPGLQRPEPLLALRSALGVDVRLENDVNLAATAELAAGVGRTQRDFAFVSVGTGVGLALVLDGRLRLGATRTAGEIGYLPLSASVGRGRPPHLEEFAAAAGLVREAEAVGLEVASAEDLYQLARAGEPVALRVAHQHAEHLALGIVAVSAIVDPALVVLGGGLGSGAADVLLPMLRDAVRRLGPLRPTLTVTALGARAVVDGAAVSAVLRARDTVLGRVTGHYRDSDVLDLRHLTSDAVEAS